jgi:hypothetical protein
MVNGGLGIRRSAFSRPGKGALTRLSSAHICVRKETGCEIPFYCVDCRIRFRICGSLTGIGSEVGHFNIARG